MIRLTLAPVVLLVLMSVAYAGDWPGWRGPEGIGVTTEKDLPVRWSATGNVRWKAPLEGAGLSTPVVYGERVFLTASDGRLNDRLHIWCFDRDQGRLLWHVKLFGSVVSEGQYAPGGMAVPTPAADSRRLYALFGTGDLVCLDHDGKPVWIRSLAQEYGPFRNRWGMAASPLLVGDLLVVQVDHWSDSYLLGVDAATGANRWRTVRESCVNWSSPMAVRVKERMEIVATGTYGVRGSDAEDGSEMWSVRGLEMQCIPSPVTEGGLVYAVSGRNSFTLAIRLDGKRGNLTTTHVVWKVKAGATYVPSPVCYNGRYYYVEDTGMATCLEARTGKRLWRERMNGQFQASLLAGDDKVYFTSTEGVISVVEAGDQFKLLSRNAMGEAVMASLAASGGRFYIRGEKHLFCVGR
jgi:outer membrane protein assembly factor BamB